MVNLRNLARYLPVLLLLVMGCGHESDQVSELNETPTSPSSVGSVENRVKVYVVRWAEVRNNSDKSVIEGLESKFPDTDLDKHFRSFLVLFADNPDSAILVFEPLKSNDKDMTKTYFLADLNMTNQLKTILVPLSPIPESHLNFPKEVIDQIGEMTQKLPESDDEKVDRPEPSQAAREGLNIQSNLDQQVARSRRFYESLPAKRPTFWWLWPPNWFK